MPVVLLPMSSMTRALSLYETSETSMPSSA